MQLETKTDTEQPPRKAPASAAYDAAVARIEAWRPDRDGPEALARAHSDALRVAFQLGRIGDAQWHGFAQLQVAYDSELPSTVRERAHNDLAVLFGSQSLYAEALEQLWTIVHLCEEDGREVAGPALNNLGNVYIRLERFDDAIALFERARERFEAAHDELGAALARSNVGRTQVLAGRSAAGIPLLESALQTFERLEQQGEVAVTLAKLAHAHGAAGAHARARHTFERALALHSQGHAAPFEHDTRAWYAAWALEVGDHATALVQFQAALAQLDDDTAARNELMNAYSHALEAAGRTAEALAALRKHVASVEQLRRDRIDAAIRVRILELETGVGGEQDVARLKTVELERRIQNLHAEARRLERLSTTDDLTGLRNRRSLDERLQVEAARAQRYDQPLVLALVDLDHFKEVNDRFDHSVGDLVLQGIAAILTRQLREADLAARWGGEEFALLLPNTNLAAAAALLDRLRQEVREHDWDHVAPGLRLTISAGAAELGEADGAEGLLHVADQRLYDAKRAGRDRTKIANDPSDEA